jgi:hypothetical protein
VRGTDGFGITVWYWASKEAIVAWKGTPNIKMLSTPVSVLETRRYPFNFPT